MAKTVLATFDDHTVAFEDSKKTIRIDDVDNVVFIGKNGAEHYVTREIARVLSKAYVNATIGTAFSVTLDFNRWGEFLPFAE